MTFEDVIKMHYDPNAIVKSEDDRHLKRVIASSGYVKNRQKIYFYFALILKDRNRFLSSVYKKAMSDKKHMDNVDIAQYDEYKRKMLVVLKSVFLSIEYLNTHQINDDIIKFIVASKVVIEYYHNGLPYEYLKLRKLYIYDIARFYMQFITINAFDIDIAKFNIGQSSTLFIEFGNLQLSLPIINGLCLPEEYMISTLKFTVLKEHLCLAELEKIDFKLTITKENGTVHFIKPNFENIEKAIDEMIFNPYEFKDENGNILQGSNDFIILESSKPISDCAFIQAAIIKVDNKQIYTVEAKFQEHVKSRIVYRQSVNDFEDVNEIKKIFNSYLLNIAPDIGNWNEIFSF